MERYKGQQTVQPQGLSSAGGVTAAGEALQAVNSLENRLSSFYKQSFENAALGASQQAVEQAAIDDAQGKEYHRESVYTFYGKAYNTAREATYASQVELDLDAKNQELMLTYKNDPNGYTNAFQSYYESVAKDAPTPQLAGVIKIGGRKTLNKTRGALIVQQKANQDKLSIEIFNQNADSQISKAVNLAISGDIKNSDLIIKDVKAKGMALLKSEVIDEATLVKWEKDYTQKFQIGLMDSKVTKLVSEGKIDEATKIVTDFESKIPDGWNIDKYNSTSATIRKKLNTAITALKADKKAQQKSVDDYLKNSIKLMEDGSEVKDLPADEVIAMASPQVQFDYKISKAANDFINGQFSLLTLKEQQKEAANIDSLPYATNLTKEVKDKVKMVVGQRAAGWKKDPITQGVVEGINQPTAAIDYNEPQNIGYLLQQRDIQANRNKEYAGGLAEFSLFTATEADEFNNFFNSDASISDKLSVLGNIFAAGPEIGNKAIRQFSNKGFSNLAFVGKLYASGNSKGAELALIGSKTKISLPEGSPLAADNYLAGVFTNLDPELFNEYKEGALNIAKGTIVQENYNPKDMTDATMNSIMKATFGERMVINNKPILIPKGATKSSFNDWIETIEIPSGTPNAKNIQDDIRSMNDIFGRSTRYQLHYVEDGSYMIYDTIGLMGRGAYLTAPDSEGKQQDIVLKYEGN